MLVHFSTLPHLMVTIETDDQMILVATKAVSVSKSELKKKENRRFHLLDHIEKSNTAIGFSQRKLKVLFIFELSLSPPVHHQPSLSPF